MDLLGHSHLLGIGLQNAITPYYVANGGAVSATGSLYVPHPTGIQKNDILVIQVATDPITTCSYTVPSGWNLYLRGAEGTSNAVKMLILWKRAIGNESGSVYVKTGTSNVSMGIMHQVRGVRKTGLPFDYGDNIEMHQTAITNHRLKPVSTIGYEDSYALQLFFMGVNDNNSGTFDINYYTVGSHDVTSSGNDLTLLCVHSSFYTIGAAWEYYNTSVAEIDSNCVIVLLGK